MKAKEIRDLIDFISQSGLDEVNIETQEFKIAVKKNSVIMATSESQSMPTGGESKLEFGRQTQLQGSETSSQEEDSNYLEIKSPMIGTFYRAPNPDVDPFISVGDNVKAGQTVCIIEAMKLFNEIESEVSGKIVKILVENSSPVEFDQPLFLVDPS
jgi:acetyl-CoA carboxylase biotin carboxyl carrier protein